MTNTEREAQRLGFPASLFGFTPNAAAYWWEPGLPWLTEQAPRPVSPCMEFIFSTDEMAPRFPAGTLVVLRPVTIREALQIGHVYVQLPAHAEPQVGRLAGLAGSLLKLSQDNGPGADVRMRNLYEVTHYVAYTDVRPPRLDGPLVVADATGAPTHAVAAPLSPAPAEVEAAQLNLLEVSGNRMGPRYPPGARYFIRQVPHERWAQATGVHALHLRDGRELLARLVGLNLDQLVLAFDSVGQLSTVALVDLVMLWKVGAADYLPEETEAEHLAIIQQPIS